MPPGSLQRCSQLRPAIHPLGGKIDKAISSTGINIAPERIIERNDATPARRML